VQLAAADEHGADLGQLARLAGEPVRLGVDDEELRVREGLIEEVGWHGPPSIRRRQDGMQVRLRFPRRAGGGRIGQDP